MVKNELNSHHNGSFHLNRAVPTKDHAVVLCSFARDCLMAMDQVTKTLEVALGPDTGELALRIGISSGPVTAGIMRGDR